MRFLKVETKKALRIKWHKFYAKNHKWVIPTVGTGFIAGCIALGATSPLWIFVYVLLGSGCAFSAITHFTNLKKQGVYTNADGKKITMKRNVAEALEYADNSTQQAKHDIAWEREKLQSIKKEKKKNTLTKAFNKYRVWRSIQRIQSHRGTIRDNRIFKQDVMPKP